MPTTADSDIDHDAEREEVDPEETAPLDADCERAEVTSIPYGIARDSIDQEHFYRYIPRIR